MKDALRVLVTFTEANKSLMEDVLSIPARNRAERIRYLASLGLLQLQGSMSEKSFMKEQSVTQNGDSSSVFTGLVSNTVSEPAKAKVKAEDASESESSQNDDTGPDKKPATDEKEKPRSLDNKLLGNFSRNF